MQPQPPPEPCILIANDPRSYREALALALRAARPTIDVREVDPGNLDYEVLRRHPVFVVCSRLSATVEHGSNAWVLLYPEGERLAVIGDEQVSVMSDLDLSGVLRLIDRAIGHIPA
jgi:hypothetical protein